MLYRLIIFIHITILPNHIFQLTPGDRSQPIRDQLTRAISQTEAEHLARGLRDVLEFNDKSASVSMYMFHGGTNFAYMQVLEMTKFSEYDILEFHLNK